VSTTPAHYPCTRQWALALHGRRIGSARPVGLICSSRVAELARRYTPLLNDLLRGDRDEVFAFFADAIGSNAREHFRVLIEELGPDSADRFCADHETRSDSAPSSLLVRPWRLTPFPP